MLGGIMAGCLLAVLLLVRVWFFGYPKHRLLPGGLLSAREQHIVAACADTLLPSGGAMPLSGLEAGLLAHTDEHLRAIPSSYRRLIRLLFLLVEHLPWVLGPRRRRFTRLTPSERERFLRGMASSRSYFLRTSFLSLRALQCMAYLANDRVSAAIGAVPRPRPFEHGEQTGRAS